jgi:3-dehydroquinate synthase
MPVFFLRTPAREYAALVSRGTISRIHEFVPPSAGKIFAVTTDDVWQLHGAAFSAGTGGRPFHVIRFAGGEQRKRLVSVETMAEEMIASGADRSSLVIAFGGGIVTDLAGFLAAVFMRGVPLIQIPTTLLAQVDAGIGGKTGANLVSGKNLIGSFHQPLAVLIDPDMIATLPEREYRAGLFEVVKYGVIASEPLFRLLSAHRDAVLARDPQVVEQIISESVRIKCEVVSADEKESGLRRILNFGHTVGHAIEAETTYSRLLHGEAVAVGMKAATLLARNIGLLGAPDCREILDTTARYSDFPSVADLSPQNLLARLARDKKSVQGTVHFVLPRRIGEVEVLAGLPGDAILESIKAALA